MTENTAVLMRCGGVMRCTELPTVQVFAVRHCLCGRYSFDLLGSCSGGQYSVGELASRILVNKTDHLIHPFLSGKIDFKCFWSS